MKIIRTSTIPDSLNVFCRGLLKELQKEGYTIIAVSSPGNALAEIEQREGVKTYAVPMERRISPLKDLKSLWGLIKLFRRERPDIVHSITPKAGLLSMLAAKITGVPVRVHMFTGLVFPTLKGIKRKILILTDKLTCACATHLLPEGEGVKHDLQRFHITKKPLQVLGFGNIRGIDLEAFNPEDQKVMKIAARYSKPNAFTFIFVGRLVREKGINELISAFCKLNKEFPETYLLLVGPYEQKIDPLNEETIKEIENNPSIEAVGIQADVRPWLLSSDALVFPSYREGFPNVVIEAGAMGLPSIVTDINGSREIIVQDINGVIIPSKNTEALYEAMKLFVESPVKVAALSENARTMVASRFDQRFVRQCLKDYYKEIVTTHIKES